MAAHTSRPLFEPLDVVEAGGRRRRWTEAEKLRIVGESLRGPRLVSSTARRHGITRSLLTAWRRQFRVQPHTAAEAEPGFVPVVVVPEVVARPAPTSPPSRMEIVTSNGRRIIVDAGVDTVALERVLNLLERR